uniref:Uncharacterized protein n=1 Tax=Cacopsylla melanoneura TaxID=428564 RepID=A0A8D8UXY7_9HEMI
MTINSDVPCIWLSDFRRYLIIIYPPGIACICFPSDDIYVVFSLLFLCVFTCFREFFRECEWYFVKPCLFSFVNFVIISTLNMDLHLFLMDSPTHQIVSDQKLCNESLQTCLSR